MKRNNDPQNIVIIEDFYLLISHLGIKRIFTSSRCRLRADNELCQTLFCQKSVSTFEKVIFGILWTLSHPPPQIPSNIKSNNVSQHTTEQNALLFIFLVFPPLYIASMFYLNFYSVAVLFFFLCLITFYLFDLLLYTSLCHLHMIFFSLSIFEYT